ncbi:MAG: AAA family ATPase [Rubrivivax sp.]|nr:AAA family ATPase [Rubrivivax sp.]
MSSLAGAAWAAPPQLAIHLLGGIELRHDGVDVALPPSRRTRALLGYLVATGAPQPRAALCDLLWEGPDDPRASLRWSLTKLRPVLDSGDAQRLKTDRDQVQFVASACRVDVQEVQSLLAGGTAATPLAVLEQAAQQLRGEFLDGLELPACYRFHHWCMAERERYGALRRTVLLALMQRLAGEPERALPYGRAMVAADPLAEAAHAALVQLLAAADRYPEAERHYEWARGLLAREVALPAGGPLDQAIRQARRQRRAAGAAAEPVLAGAASSEVPPASAAAAAPAAASAPVGPAPDHAKARARAAAAAAASGVAPGATTEAAPRPTVEHRTLAQPLLGRAAERTAITELLQGCARARLLLFAGEPGIGKTRLLDHLAEQAAAAGRRVVRGRCFEAELVRPYGLWLDALRGVPTAGLPGEALAGAAPLLAGQLPEGGDRQHLFEAAATLLRHLALQQPLALLFDDLQWVDEGSAALLHYLARTLAAECDVVFAGAARAGEIDDNRAVKGLVQSLARTGGLRRVDLGPLAEGEARSLLGAAALDTTTALHLSGGNPLFLIELARAAERGALDGIDGGPAGALRGVDTLIEERLAVLDESARSLLAWAAALGREIRPELLATAAGLPLAQALLWLERFERHGLLLPTGEGHLDFAHDLVRQAVYRTLSQPRRRAVHRQIAQVLQAASADDPWLHGEIVRHAALAGDAAAAARACLAAGEHCLRVFANAQAIEVAERGLAHVGELATGPERVRLEIGLLRLRVSAAAGPEGRQLPALADRIERAIAAAEALAMPAQAAAGWEILAFMQQRSGTTAQTLVSTLAAERLTRLADATTHCLQLANSGRCLLDIEADPERGRALLEEAAALAGELDLHVMEIEWGRGLLARHEGDLDAARVALARAVTLARGAANRWREYECMVWLATVLHEQERFAEVQLAVREILVAAARMGDMPAPFAQGLAALAQLRLGAAATGDGAAASGEVGAGDQDGADAEAALAASLQALRTLDDKAHLAYLLNEAAALALERGQRSAAAAFADEALEAARAVRRPTEVAVALARLVSASGDVATPAPSRAALRAAALAVPRTGSPAADEGDSPAAWEAGADAAGPAATTLVPTPSATSRP